MPSYYFVDNGGQTWQLGIEDPPGVPEITPVASQPDSNITLLEPIHGTYWHVTVNQAQQELELVQSSGPGIPSMGPIYTPTGTQAYYIAPYWAGPAATDVELIVTGNPYTVPAWLLEMPDTKLLDVAANDAIFPVAIRQWAQDILLTRMTYPQHVQYHNGIGPKLHAATIAALIANRLITQPVSYKPIVTVQDSLGQQYSIQTPPPFSPTEI